MSTKTWYALKATERIRIHLYIYMYIIEKSLLTRYAELMNNKHHKVNNSESCKWNSVRWNQSYILIKKLLSRDDIRSLLNMCFKVNILLQVLSFHNMSQSIIVLYPIWPYVGSHRVFIADIDPLWIDFKYLHCLSVDYLHKQTFCMFPQTNYYPND